MTARLSPATALKLAVPTALVLVGVIAVSSLVANAQPVARPSASGKAFSTKIGYKSTTPGKQQGGDSVDIEGHGSFSVKLGSTTKFVAEVMAVATGVPFGKIAQGATYKAQSALTNGGGYGLVVAHFKASGLGSACLSYSTKTGPYQISLGYVPTSGKITMVGGTGAAAKWHGSATFKQDGIGGTSIEDLFFAGALKASTGKAHGLTAACKRVAKQNW